MRFHANNPMWVSVPLENKKRIKAVFTTRHGGVSAPPYETLNMSFQKADITEHVLENYRRISEDLNIPMEQMVLSSQVHGSTVRVVEQRHCGMGLLKKSDIGDTDGLITAVQGIALVTFHADCTPVYLYDPVKNVIGLVHSGWRSTLLNITGKAVRIMKESFGCKSENILAALGPHIRKCCFEVRRDVYEQFTQTFPNMQHEIEPQGEGDKWKINLSGIIRKTLSDEGLAENNIQDICRCTVCEKELFFSHRGSKGRSGIGAALLMMEARQ